MVLRPGRRFVGLVASLAVASVALGLPGWSTPTAAAPTPTSNAVPGSTTTREHRSAEPPSRRGSATDELVAGLDAVIGISPPDTCLTVLVDGEPVYRHDATQPLAPASTEKLLTASVVLDQLGPATRFDTRVVGPAPNTDGVVTGDLTLVGGGDPVLMTDARRFVHHVGDEQPYTSLDELADQVAASGVRGVTGQVLGDDRRYDSQRTVPSWPDRYARQGQSGPLGALLVDRGYDLTLPVAPDTKVVERRSDDPAASAARTFTALLRARGILVTGDGASGAGPSGQRELAKVTSPPVAELVGQMLLTSDNQIAEQLTKELGAHAGTGGSTAAGTKVLSERGQQLGLTSRATHVVDGSGLDPTNRATCDELATVLHASGGLEGSLGPALPVAGESGTLAGRFHGNPAEGRMHAKTGSLAEVTSLAGFVELPKGETATFAYIANGTPVDAKVKQAQDLLGAILAGYVPPCPSTAGPPVVAPVAPYAAQVGVLSMFPLQSVLLPGTAVPLHVFEERYKTLVDRCLAADEDFGVVLISRGSEVGGGDVRTEVGTRTRIVQAQQAPDGRWAILGLGLNRIRVDRWLDDDPHPIAEVTDWPDDDPTADVDGRLSSCRAQLQTVLALRAELDEPGPASSVPLDIGDPTLASFHLASLAPLGDLDRQRLLEAPTVTDRLVTFADLLDEEAAVCRARLGGA